MLDFFKTEAKPASPHRGALLERLPPWMRMSPFRRQLHEEGLHSYSEDYKKGEDGVYRNQDGKEYKQELTSVPIEDALLVSSKTDDGHYVILDIDFPVEVLPSSTPGKHHVYIDKIISEEHMEKLLKVMVEVGLVNEGIYDLQWRSSKEVSLRLPWVIKGEDRPLSAQSEHLQESLAKGKKINYVDFTAGYVSPPPGYYVNNKPVDYSVADW